MTTERKQYAGHPHVRTGLALCLGFAGVLALHGATVGPILGAESVTVTEDTELVGMANPSGRITVESGTATVQTNVPSRAIELPQALRRGLTLWLDANTNVVWSDEKGGITEWRDVRETGTDSSTYRYVRAVIHEPSKQFSYLASVPPTYYDDTNNVFAGMKVVDFGEFGSGKWLYTANANGTLAKVPVKTFLIAVGLHGTHGHILADVKTLLTVSSETMFYHKASGGSGDGAMGGSNPATCVMPLGETRLDGSRVSPVSTSLPRNSFHVLTQNGPGIVNRNGAAVTPYFSTFFNQGNFTSHDGYNPRQGGGMLAEVLIYDRVLSDGERRQAEAYLRAKWFGVQTMGSAAIASGATLAVSNTLARAEVADVSGCGTFMKDGANDLYVSHGTSSGDVGYRAKLGNVRFEQLRAPVYVDAQTAHTLIVNERSGMVSRGWPYEGIVRTIGGDMNVAQRVLVDPGEIAGKTVQATNVTVVLTPRAVASSPAETVPSWAGTNLIVNGGFERPTTTSFIAVDDGSSGWTTTRGNAYAARYTSVWYESGGSYTAANRFGTNVGALQGNSSGTAAIEQTIVPPVTGTYRLSYYLSRRQSRTEDKGANAPVLVVALDGKPFHRNCVFVNDFYNYNEMNRYETLTPTLVAGREYAISFAVDDNGTKDRAVVLDEIELTPFEAGDRRIFIPNADLLSIGGAVTLMHSSTGWYADSPTRTFWGMEIPDGGEGAFGVTMDSTWWSRRDAVDGDVEANFRAMYIQRDAAATNTIVAPRAGRVRFTCQYSNRSDEYENGSPVLPVVRRTGHRLQVSVGGRVVAEALPIGARWSDLSVDFDISAGEQELRLACVRPDSNDYTVLFRNPELVYLEDEGETVTSLSPGATYAGTLVAPSNGFYRLVISAAGPLFQPCVTNGVANNLTYYPACANVFVDGEKQAQLRLQTDEFKPFELRLPYLSAGEHSFSLEVGADIPKSAFRFTDVSLEPLHQMAFERDARRDTLIDLEANSALELRYDGVFKVGKLRYRGARMEGTFSAATHPAWVKGPGVLEVVPKGIVIGFR